MPERKKPSPDPAIVRELLRTAESARDALPYSAEFTRLKGAFSEQIGERVRDNDFWRLLTRVGKQGGLSGATRKKLAAPPSLTRDQELELLRLFPDGIGSRDSLPYTPRFDELHARFRRLTLLPISKHDFWRVVSNIAKRSRKPKPIKGPISAGKLPNELLASLLDQNPWWEGKPWKRTEPYRRWAYDELVRRVDSGIAAIIALRGTRQVGKSQLQSQFIEELLLQRDVPPSHLLRVQFDEVPKLGQFESPVLEIVRWFEEAILKEPINAAAQRDETVYLFFDELQNLFGWENQLKQLVDHRSVKVIATGSSALRIAQGQDSLAGRISMIHLGSLRLREISAIRFEENLPPAIAKPNGLENWTTPEFWWGLLSHATKHDSLLRKSFEAFANYGGYPICHKLEDHAALDRFRMRDEIQRMVIDRTIRHDLKAGPSGTHRNSEIVEAVFRQVCRYAGRAVAPKTLINELRQLGHDSVSEKAVRDAIRFLADSLLIAEVPPFEGIGKKAGNPSKLCLCDHFVREAWLQEQVPLTSDEFANASESVITQAGYLAESIVGAYLTSVPSLDVSWLPETSNEAEVDFVLSIGSKRVPVEVKYRRQLKKSDSAAVRSFISQPKYNAPFGIVITREEAGEIDNVFFIPLQALLAMR